MDDMWKNEADSPSYFQKKNLLKTSLVYLFSHLIPNNDVEVLAAIEGDDGKQWKYKVVDKEGNEQILNKLSAASHGARCLHYGKENRGTSDDCFHKDMNIYCKT